MPQNQAESKAGEPPPGGSLANGPPWVLRDLLAIFLWAGGFILLIELLFSAIDLEQIIQGSRYQSLMTLGLFLLQEIIFLVLVFFYTKRKYKSTWSDFQFRWIGFFRTVGWACLAFLLFAGISIGIRLLMTAFHYDLPGFSEQSSYLPLFGDDAFSLIVAGTVIVGIAPLAEEIIFRGYLLQVLTKYRGNLIGTIFTAIVFAALHFQWETLIPLFLLGVLLNILFLRTRSIWPSIFFHVLNNSIALVAEVLNTTNNSF